MTPNLNSSENLFVANLQQVSLEKLVKSKLEVLFQQQKEAQIRRTQINRFCQSTTTSTKNINKISRDAAHTNTATTTTKLINFLSSFIYLLLFLP